MLRMQRSGMPSTSSSLSRHLLVLRRILIKLPSDKLQQALSTHLSRGKRSTRNSRTSLGCQFTITCPASWMHTSEESQIWRRLYGKSVKRGKIDYIGRVIGRIG